MNRASDVATLGSICSSGVHDERWFDERLRWDDKSAKSALDKFRKEYLDVRGEEQLGLPALHRSDEEVALSEHEIKVYDAAQNEFGAALAAYRGPADNAHVFVKLLRMKQALVNPELLCGAEELERRMARGDFKPLLSSKFARVLTLLRGARGKVVIFSQWTGALELLAWHLRQRDFGYAEYYGRMAQGMRQAEMGRFRDDPQCQVTTNDPVSRHSLTLTVTGAADHAKGGRCRPEYPVCAARDPTGRVVEHSDRGAGAEAGAPTWPGAGGDGAAAGGDDPGVGPSHDVRGVPDPRCAVAEGRPVRARDVWVEGVHGAAGGGCGDECQGYARIQ